MTVPALFTSMSSTQMTDTSSSPGLKSSLPCRDLVMSRNLLKSFICLLRSLTIHGRVKISRKAEGAQLGSGQWMLLMDALVNGCLSGFNHHCKIRRFLQKSRTCSTPGFRVCCLTAIHDPKAAVGCVSCS